MSFQIILADITSLDVDAIVNAANTNLQMGGGVCGAIFKKAGAAELQAACDEMAPIHTGEAVITYGFALKAEYIIHTAGPIYDESRPEESRRLLEKCYLSSLTLARDHDCKSIAFPLISSGIYGYPKMEALEVATTTIEDFLKENDMEVYLAVLDEGLIKEYEKRKENA